MKKTLLLSSVLLLTLSSCDFSKKEKPLEIEVETVSENIIPETETEKAPKMEAESALAACLKKYGAVVYGTSWCSHCQKQKEMFGEENIKNLAFVDCDQSRDTCLKAGIKGYPTWVIDGELYPGVQSLETLAEKTGCEY